MTAERLRPLFLQWFGLFGAPFAWALQHVAGFALTLASCDRSGQASPVALQPITVAVTIPAAVIALLSGLAAVVSLRETRGAEKDDPPPGGRRYFLALVGITIAPLFLAIILMSGSGVLGLPVDCRQS